MEIPPLPASVNLADQESQTSVCYQVQTDREKPLNAFTLESGTTGVFWTFLMILIFFIERVGSCEQSDKYHQVRLPINNRVTVTAIMQIG